MFQKRFFLRLLDIFLTFLVAGILLGSIISSPSAMIQEDEDDLPDLYWRKMTKSKKDLRAFWTLHQDILNGNKEYTKYINLEDLGPFDSFYKKSIKAQSIPSEKTIFLDLNRLSGVYLFSTNSNDSELVGFARVDATLDCGILEKHIVFKEGSPVGSEGSAIRLLKLRVNKFHGKKLCFQVEKEDKESSTYKFKDLYFYYVVAGVAYLNTSSLIAHTRAGMEPIIHTEGQAGITQRGVYFVYPPLDHKKYEEQWPEIYEKLIIPSKEKMVKLKPILKQIAEESTRDAGLEALEKFLEPTTKK